MFMCRAERLGDQSDNVYLFPSHPPSDKAANVPEEVVAISGLRVCYCQRLL